MDAADQSAREKQRVRRRPDPGAEPRRRTRALRAPRCVPRQPARDRARCSCSCSASSGSLGRVRHRVLRVPRARSPATTRGSRGHDTCGEPTDPDVVATRGRSPATSSGACSSSRRSCSSSRLWSAASTACIERGHRPRARGCELPRRRPGSSPAPPGVSPGAVMGVVLGGYIVRLGGAVRHRARARARRRGSTCRVLRAHGRRRPPRAAHVGDAPREPHIGCPGLKPGRTVEQGARQCLCSAPSYSHRSTSSSGGRTSGSRTRRSRSTRPSSSS